MKEYRAEKVCLRAERREGIGTEQKRRIIIRKGMLYNRKVLMYSTTQRCTKRS